MVEKLLEILIVDDNLDFASSLKNILEFKGYNTTVAGDEQTTLILGREKAFDLAIIDTKLPDISGEKLVEKLSKLSSRTEYIITGQALLETANEAMRQRQVIAYETKPLNMDRLLAIITQVAECKQTEEV